MSSNGQTPHDDLHDKIARTEFEEMEQNEMISLILEYIWCGGNWCKFSLPLPKAMSDQESIYLSILMNRNDMFKERYGDRYGGWFFCKQSFVKKRTGYSQQKQRRILQKLKGRNLVRTKMRPYNLGLKQWIKIDFLALSKLLIKEIKKETKSNNSNQ